VFVQSAAARNVLSLRINGSDANRATRKQQQGDDGFDQR
jgi:hypothetical protein